MSDRVMSLVASDTSATSGVTTALVGAPWPAVVLVVLAVQLLFLASLRMTYRAMYRFARLTYTGSFRGAWGVEWKASTEPENPESASRGSPRRPP